MSTSACLFQHSGGVELYFYGELDEGDRAAFERHLPGCSDCRESLEDLSRIRAVLAARPRVEAPPSDDWSAFMSRLEGALAAERTAAAPAAEVPEGRRSVVQLFAMAALLALVTIGILFAARAQPAPSLAEGPAPTAPLDSDLSGMPGSGGPGLAAAGQQHLERSKLVLLGLASKDAERTPSGDWLYERELASRLLTDTRLYRQAAEARGLSAMASVMRDLEFVLLQTSMSERHDVSELSQIQRAIRSRDLLQKMDVVRTAGM